MKTKTFVVVSEEYTQSFGGGEIDVNIIKAKSLDDLIRKIETPPTEENWDGTLPSPTEWLKDSNGDGMDYYVIKELLPNGKLGKNLV